MTRIALIILIVSAAVACSNDSKLDGARSVSNLVCARIAIDLPKAECVPEYTDVGDQHVHIARITVEKQTEKGTTEKATFACGLSMNQISMSCGELISRPPQPGQPPQPPPAVAQQQGPPAPRPLPAPPAPTPPKVPPKK